MTAKFVETKKITCLFINDEEITHYFKEEHTTPDGKTVAIDVCANDFELSNEEINELLKLPNSLIPKCFDFYKEKYQKIQDGHITIVIDSYHVALIVEHNLEAWTNHYKYSDFLVCYGELLSEGTFKIEDELVLTLGFDDTYEESMLPQIVDAIEWLNVCYIKAQNLLNKQTQNDIFTKLFNFPPTHRNICTQYLIWFGEFLKNLDIDANVSAVQDSNQTKLIVAPDECPELLGEIENLFYQYLSLPYAKLLPPETTLTSRELHAYQSAVIQVQHLQTQIQLKDSIIANYQATNTKLIKETGNQPTLLTSLKDDNKYKIFGGLLEISKKQKFGKNDNLSIDLSKISKLLRKN